MPTAAAMRSLSFTRSSAAPAMTVSPVAAAPSTATRGSSSSARRASVPVTMVPWRSAPVTVTSPTGSPWHVPVGNRATRAPITSRMSRKPVRPGLSVTPRTVTSAPGLRAAAASRKAAAERSPGRSYRPGWTGPGRTSNRVSLEAAPEAHRLEPALGVIAEPRRRIDDAPPFRLQRGEGRAGANLRRRPGGWSGWPREDGPRQRPPAAGPREPVRRARPSAVSGPTRRPMGRNIREASPTSVVENGRAARAPASRRIVVAELPGVDGPRRRRPGRHPGRADDAVGDAHAQGLQRRDGGRHVLAGPQVGDVALAVSHGGQQQGAMGERLVPRDGDLGPERAPGQAERPHRRIMPCRAGGPHRG